MDLTLGLAVQAERLGSDQDLTFPDELGRPTDPASDRREWKSLLQQAGVRDARLHDARHTAATLLLVQGVDLRTLMSIMWVSSSSLAPPVGGRIPVNVAT